MNPYQNRKVYYGDIHTHCNISYGHGSLEQALRNARCQLDFCSVTGHAHWHDMPEPDENIDYIIDFHKKGFQKLKAGWADMMKKLTQYNQDQKFIIFPGFEIHSNCDGDRTIIYKDLAGEIIYAEDFENLYSELRELKAKGLDSIAFPHHIAYKTGTRGINWQTFNNEFSPFVELISMHGCSETSENTRPYLHSMGPANWENTALYGLLQGHIFGFCGNTDHHSAHPGSYGHGRTAVWADSLQRQALWQAFYDRLTYALTGDNINLKFDINGSPMGSIITENDSRNISIELDAGAAIDYVDLVKDGILLKRFSQCDLELPQDDCDLIETKVHLELGWGARNKSTKWDVELELSEGVITDIEPRFRGTETVSPVEKKDDFGLDFASSFEKLSENKMHFTTLSEANPNNTTCTTQGVCVYLKAPVDAVINAKINKKQDSVSIKRLVQGSYTGVLGKIDSPAYKFNKAPKENEYRWKLKFVDSDVSKLPNLNHNFYYVRVRQKNDQWAWSSPIFVR